MIVKKTEDMLEVEGTPIQAKIEAVMQELQQEDRWESIFLFSSEGLVMASYGGLPEQEQENIFELYLLLNKMIQQLDGDITVNETTVRGWGRKTLVFRYFNTWNEELTLVAIVSGKKGYRRAMGRLVKFIGSLD